MKSLIKIASYIEISKGYQFDESTLQYLDDTISEIYENKLGNNELVYFDSNIGLATFYEGLKAGKSFISTIGLDGAPYLKPELNAKFRAIRDNHHVEHQLNTDLSCEIKLGLLGYELHKSHWFSRFYRSEVAYQAIYHAVFKESMTLQKVIMENLM